jgi:hypothetical protein
MLLLIVFESNTNPLSRQSAPMATPKINNPQRLKPLGGLGTVFFGGTLRLYAAAPYARFVEVGRC